MACAFNLKSMLTSNLDEVSNSYDRKFHLVDFLQDAATITEVLRQICELLAKNKELASKVPNVITEKKDQARIKTLLKYRPDIETIDLLEQFHETWLKTPALFDEYVESPQWAAMDPWTRIFSMYLETELANRADSV